MSDEKITRRHAAGLSAAALLVAISGQDEQPHESLNSLGWLSGPCPRCGASVAFLPDQYLNRCGWCGQNVGRAG